MSFMGGGGGQFFCGSRNYIHKTPDINSRRKKKRE